MREIYVTRAKRYASDVDNLKTTMANKRFLGWLLLCAALIGGCAAQGDFGITNNDRELAIKTGRIKEFIAAMEARGSAAEANGRWAAAAEAYGQAASAANTAGDLQKAVTYRQKQLESGRRSGISLYQTRAMLGLAGVYERLRLFEKQREMLEQGLEIARKQYPQTRREGMFHAHLARYYYNLDDLPNALEHANYGIYLQDSKMLDTPRSAGTQWSNDRDRESRLIAVLEQLGHIQLKVGNGADALSTFQRTLGLVRKNGEYLISWEAGVLAGVGRSYLARKDYPRAVENLTAALQMAESRRDDTVFQYASSALGETFLQIRREAEAVSYFKKTIDSIESIRSLLPSEELRTSFFSDKTDAYNGIIQASLELKNFSDAFNYSERSRARAFLDVLGSKVQLGRSGALMEQERTLQGRISLLQARLQAQEEGEDRPARSDLRKELDQAQREYASYLARLRQENKEQASLMNVEPLTLAQVQELLDPGDSLLEYFVVNDHVYVWVVEKDRAEFVRTAVSRKDLVAKITELRDIIYQFGEKQRFTRLSQELHKLLIEPALAHIKGKELILVPHDVLHYLPFHALQGADGKYLIENYPMSYLSSASLMQFTKEKRRAKAQDVLAFGNPDLGDRSRDLDYAELEAEEVKSAYPTARVYVRQEANEENAKAHAPQNDIIHFASHAELKESDPLSSAVLLAKSGQEDGRLEVREIFGMNLKANLVVLSACDTALGKLSSGDELVGLTRAFIYAGTPSVVASLWQVDDVATAGLMSRFYKNLKTMTKVEALRQAQLDLIRGKGDSELLARRGAKREATAGSSSTREAEGSAPMSRAMMLATASTTHPYFWAPFVLVGDGK